MKTIFRYANLGLLVAAMMAIGAVAGMAQDACTDAEGQTKMQEEFDKLFANKTDLDVRLQALNSGKAFLDKYGACESTKDRSDWLKINIPKLETKRANDIALREKAALLKRFDAALTAKNWDETYVTGKEVLAKHGDEFRAVELVLGSIGYDEMFTGNNKYSDETLRFAKQSLADLDAKKDFKPNFGVGQFSYKTREEATAWMNLTIGSILQIAQKNKVAALPYLYKATLATETAKNPNPYEFIGGYYFDELNKIVEQIQAKAKEQNDADAPEVAQKKVDEIKALVAMSNGTAERAMDAFSRAFSMGQKPDYKARMKKNVEEAYNVRFGKKEPVDSWIATAVAKPFVNPQTPVAPITDPEPVKTDATSSTPTAPAITAPAKAGTPATNTTTTKPAGPIKPAPAKPGSGVKPQATVKKVAKKKVG